MSQRLLSAILKYVAPPAIVLPVLGICFPDGGFWTVWALFAWISCPILLLGGFAMCALETGRYRSHRAQRLLSGTMRFSLVGTKVLAVTTAALGLFLLWGALTLAHKVSQLQLVSF